MTNNNEVEVFNPDKLMDGVKDRIKATFVSLIPDENWEQLVSKVIKDFMTIKEKSSGYGSNTIIESDFEAVVKGVMREHLKEAAQIAVIEFMDSGWDSEKGHYIVNEQIKKMIVDNAGKIFANIIGDGVQQVVNNLRNQSF